MKLVTAAEMRSVEQRADASGLSYTAMMDAAGRAVATVVHEQRSGCPALVVVLVGPGNNGGDGLVAARYLHDWGHRVQVVLWKRAPAQDANLDQVIHRGIPTLAACEDSGYRQVLSCVASADVLIDAVLGTGQSGPLRDDLRAFLSMVSRAIGERGMKPEAAATLRRLTDLPPRIVASPAPLIVAVDVPTGLNSDSGSADVDVLVADLTVTFAFPKRGQMTLSGLDCVGDLVIADIGIPAALSAHLQTEVATAREVAAMLPRRSSGAYKGTFGRAMIVAGSVNYVGAPRLAALAAYRVGAGLVTLGVAEEAYSVVAASTMEPTFLVLPDDLGVVAARATEVLMRALPGYDVLLLGPGLGRERPTMTFLESLLGMQYRARGTLGFIPTAEADAEARALPPLVIDADGLNMLSQDRALLHALPPDTILTPHVGEMARLLGGTISEVNENRIELARASAQEWGCVVVLKGALTVVASPLGNVTVIPFANAALATAGTGDVLAGAIAGFRAQGMPGYQASVCAAFAHGMAGQRWALCHGSGGMLAGDLLALLPDVLRDLREPGAADIDIGRV